MAGSVRVVDTPQGFEQRAESKDPDFRNTKRVTASEVETLVRNVYKVLLTRGVVSTLCTR